MAARCSALQLNQTGAPWRQQIASPRTLALTIRHSGPILRLMPLCAQDDGDAVQAAREELALLQGLRPDAKPHGAGKFARLLRHPAIVQALAVDETSGQLQMVFAFLSGALACAPQPPKLKAHPEAMVIHVHVATDVA